MKTNVGHLEATSGVAGVVRNRFFSSYCLQVDLILRKKGLLILGIFQVKTVLMLENKVYLPNRNFRRANPKIPLKEWKLTVMGLS